jgi:hypothetical protein
MEIKDVQWLLIHTFDFNLFNNFPCLHGTRFILVIGVFSIILILMPWMKQKFLYSIQHREFISCVLKGKSRSSNIC